MEKFDSCIQILRSDVKMFIKMIEEDENILNMKCAGWNLLHLATTLNKKEAIKFLIEKGIDPNDGDISIAPLLLAINDSRRSPNEKVEKLEIIKLLVDKGANVNPDLVVPANNPLYLAVMKNEPEIVGYLLMKGAQMNTKANPTALVAQLKKRRLTQIFVRHNPLCFLAEGLSSKDRLYLAQECKKIHDAR